VQSSTIVDSAPAISVRVDPQRSGPSVATRPSREVVLLIVYLAIMSMFVVVGALAPLLAPQSPDAQQLTSRLRPPVW
jgi:peptide/nickel transport system permease protein